MSDPERCFVDSNIWLYAFIAGQDQEKTRKAGDLIQRRQNEIVVSVQVIGEVCVNLIKKAGYAEADIRSLIESFYATYPVIELKQSVLLQASELRERYSISFWDSSVVACALQESVSVLFSEDLHRGLVVEDRLRIVNLFEEESRND